MKLKQFYKAILYSICFFDLGCAAKLTIGEKHGSPPTRTHLAFENNKGDSILYYEGYSVIFSYTYNLPRYIFNLLTVEQLVLDSTKFPVKRTNSYYPAVLPNGARSASNEDYSKSGYDRGHMVPAGDFLWNKKLKDETFLYTNINPQTAVLNRGIWANLENRIRSKVVKNAEDAYIVTGAVFNSACENKIGPNELCVPVAFFKIVYFERRNSMFAFLFDNTVDNYEGNIAEFQVSVNFIEQITREDFFDLLDDEIEEKMESEIISFND
ncbi:MAG: DNA/RNA non-specific endonuclease [Bacteroidetes bacterium]|nr:MAG: DNA/RNA non-specific endonuclease [Bacteroidota bacterium]